MISNRLRRLAAPWLLGLAALGLSARTAHAQVNHLVISQVYGGGGNAGAQYSNDFIELFNPTNADISLTGLSVQYASAAGTSYTNLTVLTGTVHANSYFLIQEVAGTTASGSLPTPDQTGGTINLSGTAGKVALVNGTSAITDPAAFDGAAAIGTGTNIIDYVGFGTTATRYEGGVAGGAAGTFAAPTLSNTTSAQRAGGGATDTNNNKNDFTAAAPLPRNSSYSATAAPTVTSVTFDNATVQRGNSVTITAVVNPGSPAVTSVTADLTPIGGSATAALSNGGSGNTYSITYLIPVGTTTGSKHILVTATNPTGSGANSGDFTVSAAVPPSITSATFSPATLTVGGATTLTVTVTPGTGAITSVTADLSSIGGSATAALSNGGSGNTYTLTYTVPTSTAIGAKSIPVKATDTGGNTDNSTASLTLNPITLTVAAARAHGPDTNNVSVLGVVTSITAGSGEVYIEDSADDVGPTNAGIAGIQVFGAGTQVIGNRIIVTGQLEYFRGELELATSAANTSAAGTATVPPAAVLTIPQMQTIGAAPDYPHPNEGRLITLHNVTVTSVPGAASGVYNVTDPSGNAAIVFVPTQATAGGLANPITATTLVQGDVYDITGINTYFGLSSNDPRNNNAAFELKPRDANDITDFGTGLIGAATETSQSGSSAGLTGIAERGATALLSVTTSPASGSTVTADLSGFGGSATTALTDNGSGAYTATFSVPGTETLGPTTVPIHVANSGNTQFPSTDSTIAVTVITALKTEGILAARNEPDYTQVKVTGVVTANTVGTGQTYLQDGPSNVAGTGGIETFASSNVFASGTGDTWTVQGIKTTFSGAVELDYTLFNNGSTAPAFVSSGTAPTPATVTEAAWPTVTAQLVTTTKLQILASVSAGTGNTDYIVTDGTSTGEVFIASQAAFGTTDLAQFTVGATFDATGIVEYFSGSRSTFEIKPRNPSDVTFPSSAGAPAVVPNKVTVTTEPTNGTVGGTLSPVAVTVQDTNGVTDTAFTGPVTIAIKSGTGTTGAVLSGTTTVNAVNGVATFNNLSINQAGTGYVLSASVYGLTGDDSATFDITAAAVPFTVTDAKRALQIAGGLVTATTTDKTRLDIVKADGTAGQDSKINLQDAVRIARKITGKDTPNP